MIKDPRKPTVGQSVCRVTSILLFVEVLHKRDAETRFLYSPSAKGHISRQTVYISQTTLVRQTTDVVKQCCPRVGICCKQVNVKTTLIIMMYLNILNLIGKSIFRIVSFLVVCIDDFLPTLKIRTRQFEHKYLITWLDKY